MSCLFCGRPLGQSHSGRGRPRELHDECRRPIEGLRYIETFVLDVVPTMTPSDQALIRRVLGSRFFSLANQMNRHKPNGSKRKASEA